jgi:hypothetical protein
VIDEDLSEFADGARVSAIALPGFEGMRSRYAVEERYWEKYWLRNGTLMLHVTYNCALEDQGTEHEQVIAILESLRAAI